jgi:hypothetical protein
VGHFLTRKAAAQRARISPEEVLHRPDLLRIGGRWLEEVYFAFQFDDGGINRDLGAVVLMLRREYDDIEIADWLAEPNPELGFFTPLRWSAGGLDRHRLVAAAERHGPHHDLELPPRPVDDRIAGMSPGGGHAGRRSRAQSPGDETTERPRLDGGRRRGPREVFSPGA